jgi:predicted transcriptional regulator YheO
MNPLDLCVEEAFRRGTLVGSTERAVEACLSYYSGLGLERMSNDHLQQIVRALDNYGVFRLRNSVNTVAKMTGVSRVKIYELLKK